MNEDRTYNLHYLDGDTEDKVYPIFVVAARDTAVRMAAADSQRAYDRSAKLLDDQYASDEKQLDAAVEAARIANAAYQTIQKSYDDSIRLARKRSITWCWEHVEKDVKKVWEPRLDAATIEVNKAEEHLRKTRENLYVDPCVLATSDTVDWGVD